MNEIKPLKNVFLTGATGNVGMEILRLLKNQCSHLQFFAGVRNIDTDRYRLYGYPVEPRKFDFFDTSTHANALAGMDTLFLLRPPQISQIDPFLSILKAAKDMGMQFIVFISVQGVEKSSFIPHYKIEREIIKTGIPYCFLRPAYFMQNFTTSLKPDIVDKSLIYLPAGSAKFTLLDLIDLAEVSLKVMEDPDPFMNSKMDLTSNELLSFAEMALFLSSEMGRTIKFKSPSLLEFFIRKRKEGMPTPLILVMIMLHYLPRFQKAPKISPWVYSILGREPYSFESFILRNKSALIS